jgi:hypothetical protein
MLRYSQRYPGKNNPVQVVLKSAWITVTVYLTPFWIEARDAQNHRNKASAELSQ